MLQIHGHNCRDSLGLLTRDDHESPLTPSQAFSSGHVYAVGALFFPSAEYQNLWLGDRGVHN